MAKELQWDSIDAKIVEFISSKETIKDILYREKIDFFDTTGLPFKMDLSEIGQYKRMMDQIINHKKFLETECNTIVSTQEASSDWHKTIYKPLVTIIEKGKLIGEFEKRSITDLYMYISTHQWGKRQNREYGSEIDNLIAKSMEEFRAKMSDKSDADYPEMQREITVFVLMNVLAKREFRIIEKMFSLNEVKEIHAVHGNQDLLIKVVLTRDLLSSDAETISLFVHDNIRQITGVSNTQTLIPGYSKIKKD